MANFHPLMNVKERSYKVTMSLIRNLGARIAYPVVLPWPFSEAFDYEGKDILGRVIGMSIVILGGCDNGF